MAKTNLAETREREDPELLEEIEKLHKELFDMRFKGASQAIANPSRVHAIRRGIARLKTILRERALSIRGQSVRGAK